MKSVKLKFMGILLLSLSGTAIADNITLVLSGEEQNGKTKICEYSNSMYDFTLTLKSYQDCPHTHTFDNDSQ